MTLKVKVHSGQKLHIWPKKLNAKFNEDLMSGFNLMSYANFMVSLFYYFTHTNGKCEALRSFTPKNL